MLHHTISYDELLKLMLARHIKSRMLPYLQVCLGHMGHVRGVRAVKEARRTEPEPEAGVAMLAIQLGMLTDAARLYSACGRWDLLNKLYQVSSTLGNVFISLFGEVKGGGAVPNALTFANSACFTPIRVNIGL